MNQNIAKGRGHRCVQLEYERDTQLNRERRLFPQKGASHFPMDLPFNQRLQTAAGYSLEAWIPIEENHYRFIREGLSSGRFATGSELFEELVKDPALYFHCLRRLIDLKQQEPGRMEDEIDPVAIFNDSGVMKHVSEIFACAPGLISRHRLSDSNEVQTRSITSSLISASVAATIAGRDQVDPRLSCATALFRQLGLLLIAFNYPHVYSKIMGRSESNRARKGVFQPASKFDSLFAALLGFSPTLLGVTIARSWSISPVIRNAMGDPSADLAGPEAAAHARLLEKICRIGEAFARASSPDLFPSAPIDWENAREQITSSLDTSGIKMLEANIRAGLEHYLRSAPQLFQIPAQVAAGAIADHPGASHGFGNKYVPYCPISTHDQFREFYTRLSPERIEKENVDFLIQKLVVPLGFSRGCAYLLEPDSLTLIPRLAIGDTRLTDFKPLNYQDFTQRDDAVIAAFRSPTPITGEAQGSGGKVDFIAGSLGNIQRAGVLYLELSRTFQYDPNANPLACFKALREAFNACLWLS